MRCPTCGHEHSSDIFDNAAQCASQPSGERDAKSPFMMLSCVEAKRCLHQIPGCICDQDPAQPATSAPRALAERLASKKAGVRGFPAIENEVNLGYVTEEERNLIVAALYDHPAVSCAAREAIADAFVAGADAVHAEWVAAHDRREGPPRGDPSFGEAARDYARAICASLRKDV